jgi:hypothetical protein
MRLDMKNTGHKKEKMENRGIVKKKNRNIPRRIPAGHPSTHEYTLPRSSI